MYPKILAVILFTFLVSLFYTVSQVRANESQVLTHLVMRDRVITISQGEKGELLYSIHSQEGAVLDPNLNEEQLQAKYPEIYENIRPAIAGDSEEFEPLLLMLEDGNITP